MKITPEEIKSQKFKTSFRGFDTLEVRDFLDFIANEMTSLIEEYDRLKNRVQKKDELLQRYQKEEESLKKAMLTAQQIADEIREKAQIEAKKIVDNAEKEKELIADQTKKDMEILNQQIAYIIKTKESFIKKLQNAVNEGEKLLKSWNFKSDETEKNEN
ncbi:MAG: hypothetical protein A2161_12960 [Candidatus Schekmanbacteria bacterium RBG_13_48_7]|uniref:DivIVA domain-containing protein n=1 Tax=Candidatus Schekmanbacteria bacterium RBG_13_48_7 TaxID=1817878 RepID=A0A1F7RUY3_9BACT|nr:MAG: hypothetical protein A2161_12960 [Candidatus Schekmanbacteria bacterium RBG_13_48_7]